MKKTASFLLYCVVLATTGCSEPESAETKSPISTENIRSEEEAQSEIESILAQIDQKTRAGGGQRKIRNPYYSYGKIQMSRSDISDENTMPVYSDLARLGEIITRSENLDMHFSLTGSGAYCYNIPRTLEHLGYFYGGTFADWNEEIVLNELKEYPSRPVVVSAYAKRIQRALAQSVRSTETRSVTYTEGHAFLLESAVRSKRTVRDGFGYSRTEYQTLVYVNYGWGGVSNGYYNAGVFNTNKGPVMKIASEGEDNNYQFHIQMVYGVRI